MTGISMTAYGQGFALSAGLIAAIGAQNVFVLSHGARADRPLLVAIACTLCDALLISAGVGGVGGIAAGAPVVTGVLGLGGAAFLAVYGLRALKSAWNAGAAGLEIVQDPSSRSGVVLAAVGVSLLNPHALLDTIVLIGGLSAQLPPEARASFGLGAVTASACWFGSLSLCGRALAPVLRRPQAWRVVDGLVCLTMWTLAFGVGRDAWRALASLG